MKRGPKRLEVFLGGKIGEIVQDQGGCIRFLPDEAWLVSGQVPRLGLRFLEEPFCKGNGHLPHWFENLLPEQGSYYRSWICKKLGIRDTDSMALLAALGSDLPGAVEIQSNRDQSSDESDAAVGASSKAQLRPSLRFALAGMQLKVSMLLAKERFVWPATDQSGDWILKVPGKSFPDLVSVEFATMSWAKAIGLATPQFREVPVELISKDTSGLMQDVQSAFAIERFDRVNGQKIHQEDFAQVFNLAPSDKYGSDPSSKVPTGAYGFLAMARLIRDAAGESMLEEFVRRLAFTIASGNDDAHLKNWSFQWERTGRPRLSPCYDQVCTIAWPEAGFGWSGSSVPTTALGFVRRTRFDELHQASLMEFTEQLGHSALPDLFMDTLERCRSTWISVRNFAPQRMRNALSEHWRRVPLLSDLEALP